MGKQNKGRRTRKEWKLWQKILMVPAVAAGIALLGFLIVLVTLTVTEYKPADVEKLALNGKATEELSEGDAFSIMTWNVGYGALGENADFFMDGGTHVSTADKELVETNVKSIGAAIAELSPDIVYLQEVDLNSKRSHYMNEQEMLMEQVDGYQNTFACNYRVCYVPYPLPTIGKVDCGIMTLSNYEISSAERIALPCPFTYPIRLANLKRCLMVDRIPIKGSDKELVLVNLHLEAYDEGAGKAAQTEMLRELLQEEADKGNYVIAGGDFNQTFSGADSSLYPIINDKLWQPGAVDESVFADGWQFEMDTDTPSCRSLDQPYEGADQSNFQYYPIDGFIVSSNIQVDSVKTQDLQFVNSDHNPVLMNVILQK